MKKLTMSLAVSAIVASGAFATSLEDAFAKGKVSGEIGAYTTAASNSGGTADSGYSLGSVSLNYETASLNGFKASLGFMANTKFSEKVAGDYGTNAPKSVMNVANVSYSNDMGALIVGKQAIDLEWIADYHEAVVGVVSAIPNTTIILGHTERFNANANDGALSEFAVSGTEKGANVLDVTYEIDKTTKVGAYYMDAPDVFSAVGAKVEAEVAGLGVVAKYATTSEDAAGTKDGSIMALDLGYKVGEIALNGGYIKAGKDNGTGSIAALGDNINPLDSGNRVYGGDIDEDGTVDTVDSSTFYVGASTTVAGFELGALYGTTSYTNLQNANKSESESELNLTASWECKLLKGLNISALYSNISAETSAGDSSYYSLQAVYSF